MADELRGSAFGGGTIPRTMLLNVKVGQQLKVSSRFRYIFDLGDGWTHFCTVERLVDPLEVLGNIPDDPTAYWGWGTIPDQYGRRWDADDGESDPPSRDTDRLERFGSPEPKSPTLIDLSILRRAVAGGRAGDVIGRSARSRSKLCSSKWGPAF